MRTIVVGSVVVCFALFAAACAGGGGGGSSSGSSEGGSFTSGGGSASRVAIDNYVNDFILPLLAALDQHAESLEAAVRDLVASPTEANLAAARAAWVAARVPWERSETALFGPVDFYGFDPAMDTWPVNQTDLEGVLAGGAALNGSSVGNLDNTLKGFHTIEYLIYGQRGEKQAAALSASEGDYLKATAAALSSVTSSLYAAWASGYNGQAPYAEEVVAAGQGSQVFPSESSAVEQFVRGIIVICDEVANGKIADPFDQRNPNIVESQFSGNSLADFANNIIGAKLAYSTSVSALVSAQDSALDARVLAAFDAAIGAIQSIPEPFLNAIQSSANDSTIRAAQQATRNVQSIMEGEVLPLVLG